MPGASFGKALTGWVRLSLPESDLLFEAAVGRIIAHARSLDSD